MGRTKALILTQTIIRARLDKLQLSPFQLGPLTPLQNKSVRAIPGPGYESNDHVADYVELS